MSLLLFFKSRSPLSLLAIMNQCYGDEVKKRKKRKYDDEIVNEDLSEPMNLELNKYADLDRSLETWQSRIDKGIQNERLAKAAYEAVQQIQERQAKIARIILEMQEEEYLLGLLLLQ